MKTPHFAISISLLVFFTAVVVVGMNIPETDQLVAENGAVGIGSFLVPIGIMGGGMTMVFSIAHLYYMKKTQKCIEKTSAFYHEAIEAGLPEYPSPEEDSRNMTLPNLIAEY